MLISYGALIRTYLLQLPTYSEHKQTQLLEEHGVETVQGSIKSPKGLLRKQTVNRCLSRWRLDQPRLRRTLAERKQQAWHTLLPAEVKIHRSESGYFLWIELPDYVDVSLLSERTIVQKISIAPGKMFTTGRAWDNYFRLNASWEWGEREQ